MIKQGILLQIIVLLFFSFSGNTQKERIYLDGLFDDWTEREYAYSDNPGDGRFGYDFKELTIENDEVYIYFQFDTGIEINLQEYNDIALLLDTDDDYNTGYPIDNIGAELIYYFGDRGGAFFKGNSQYNIQHDDIGLITLPTVSGEKFEIGISRNSEIGGFSLFSQENIRCILLHDVQNGDKLPDQSGGVPYRITDQLMVDLPEYSITQPAFSDFRILSYNVLRDRIFEAPAPFQRQITALDPDIIAFQEIYDQSAAQTRNLIENWLGGSWFSAKQGNDIITVSRFPILESYYVAGNGAFLIDVEGNKILLINAHLPCCDNDSGRQEEADAIMAFIRDAREGQSSLDLDENTPVIITGDMNFVGKNRQVRTLLEGDIQNEFIYGEDFAPDWDNTPYKDAIPFASHTPHAFTWYDLYSSYNPGRLDYMIYSDAVLKLDNTFNLFSQALPSDSLTTYSLLRDDTGNASDHIPVVADFSFDDGVSVENASVFPGLTIEIFPNPVTDHFKLEFSKKPKREIFVKVFNQLGHIVYSSSEEDGRKRLEIDASLWPPGTYQVFIFNHKNRIVKSLIKH